MTHRPRVSVILPSYNHALYLRESIDSVLNQTFGDFELIVVDDASPDESWAIIGSYADERIRASRNPQTEHQESLLRSIPNVAAGEYIAIQNSDDAWEPRKLEQQVRFLDENPAVGAVFTHVQVIEEDGRPFEDESDSYFRVFDQPNRTRYEWLRYFFEHGNALCHPSVLIRKTCFADCGAYRFGLGQGPDLDLWIRVCLKYDIHVLPEKLVRFRILPNQANASRNRLDSRICAHFELLQLLHHYRAIGTFEELVQVFPIAEKYGRPGGGDIDFALAMVALETKPSRASELFGLNTLFEELNDPNKAPRLRELYGFGPRDLVQLSSRHDVFGIADMEKAFAAGAQLADQERKVQVLTTRATEQDLALQDLADQLHQKDLLLQDIFRSKAWRLITLVRRLLYGNRLGVSR